ncbi:stalk domain-containing protein [Paenibacillus sp. S-38]|uniref:stalk domain-containing protein n=1 Tax=Paenibacillus sp. S-38 TaxID=3416710 RepID=UPI003CF80311
MSKKILAPLAACTMFLAPAVLADSSVDVRVGLERLPGEAMARLEDGSVRVNLRALAEALDASVVWDAEHRAVSVSRPDDELQRQRIALLEEALAARTAQEAAQKYLDGIRERNGAKQYAVLSAELQSERRASMEAVGWRTGSSSPWWEFYTADEGRQRPDGTWEFTARGVLADSTGTREEREGTLLVKEEAGRFVIVDDGFAERENRQE